MMIPVMIKGIGNHIDNNTVLIHWGWNIFDEYDNKDVNDTICNVTDCEDNIHDSCDKDKSNNDSVTKNNKDNLKTILSNQVAISFPLYI